MNFLTDFETQDAVAMLCWGTGQRTERTVETLESAKQLIAQILEYRCQIKDDGKWPIKDRYMFLDEQIKKIETWIAKG